MGGNCGQRSPTRLQRQMPSVHFHTIGESVNQSPISCAGGQYRYCYFTKSSNFRLIFGVLLHRNLYDFLTEMLIRRLLSSSGVHAVDKRSRIVILGCGWGGFRLARVLDKKKFDVTVISPRNHFVFTPLLPSTAVGTIEFRCVQV